MRSLPTASRSGLWRSFPGLRGVARLETPVILIGGVVLLGWALDVSTLKGLPASFSPIKPNAALAFVLAGVSVALLRAEDAPPGRRRAGRALAAVVALIGALTLGEYLFGWNLGIDELLFDDPQTDVGDLPGRMGVASTIGLVLAGLALLLLDVEIARRVRPAEVLAVAMGSNALFALAGHLYGAHPLEAGISDVPMAEHSVVAFLLLAAAVLGARPDRGVMAVVTSDGAGGIVVRGALPFVIAVPIVSGWLTQKTVEQDIFSHELGHALLAISLVVATGTGIVALGGVLTRYESERQREYLKFRGLLESAPDGIVIAGPQGRIELVNRQTESQFGYRRAELIGRPVEALIPEWAQAKHSGLCAGYRASPRASPMGAGLGLSARRKDGTEFPVDVSLASVELDDRLLVVASIRDVTERKLAEEGLRASESRFRALFESVPDAVLVIGSDDRIRFANSQTGAVLGYRPDELLDRPLDILIPERARAVHAGRMSRYLRDSRPRPMGAARGLVALRKDGSEIPVDISLSPTEADGEMLVMAMVRDITAQAQAEAEIRAMTEQLEQRVRDRTAELEEANRELETFSYSVSHDLRAPLRAIDGFARILEQEVGSTLPPASQRHLGLVRRSAQEMGTLIDALLKVARLGRHSVSRKPVELGELVREVLGELRAEQDGRAVEISIGDLPTVPADRLLLKQVLANLLSNALKFTRHRDPALIEVGSYEEAGTQVVYVRDNGAGFDMRHVNSLFRAFQRLHRVDDYEGSGIGLALAARIVRLHSGRIWAEGAPGEGATFYFTLAERSEA